MSSLATHGNTSVKEQIGSPEIAFRAGQDVMTRNWRGIYSELYALRPAEGTTYPDLDPQWVVDEVTIRADRGPHGIGTMVVTLTNWASMDPIYELEWVDLERSLLLHPRYAPGGAKALSATDHAQIAAWQHEPDPALRKEWKFRDPSGAEITLSTNAQDFAAKWLAGTEAYRTAYPLVRATTFHRTIPPIDNPYTPDTPPAAAHAPTGWEWLYGPPRRIFRRWYWELQEHWIGATDWDGDLYA